MGVQNVHFLKFVVFLFSFIGFITGELVAVVGGIENSATTKAVTTSSTQSAEKSYVEFGRNCTINERLQCFVKENCHSNEIARSRTPPGPAHDLRMYPFLVANSRRHPNSYELWVNITWTPPYDRSIMQVRGFELTILEKESNVHHCFQFYMPSPQWVKLDREMSRTFRFWTKNLFKLGKAYFLELETLPKAAIGVESPRNFVSKDVVMPEHPGSVFVEPGHPVVVNLSVTEAPMSAGQYNCSGRSNKHAHRWLASLRKVIVFPYPKEIYVEFTAAPPQFCFEKYELRLYQKDRIMQSKIITKENIYFEEHPSQLERNRTVLVDYGNYTFTGLQIGSYDIGILPGDYSDDGYCLCPMDDGHMCSCSMAKWPDVVVPDLSQPKKAVSIPTFWPFLAKNGTTVVENEPLRNNVLLVSLLLASFVTIALGAVAIFILYRRYHREGFKVLLYPVGAAGPDSGKDPNPDSALLDGGTGALMAAGTAPPNILIVYSHDCPKHEAVIRAFAEFLKQATNCNIVVDFNSVSEIAENKYDWVHKSMSCDLIIFVNSIGAYLRYEGKFFDPPYLVRRRDAMGNDSEQSFAEFDDLFLLLLDNMQEECLGARIYPSRSTNGYGDSSVVRYRSPAEKYVSVYFNYTPKKYVIQHIIPHARFECMRDIDTVISCVNGTLCQHRPRANQNASPVSRDSRAYDGVASAAALREAIDEMTSYQINYPNWFEQWHVRCPIALADVVNAPPEISSSSRTSPNRRYPMSTSSSGHNRSYVVDSMLIDQDDDAPLLADAAGPAAADTLPLCTIDSGVSVGGGCLRDDCDHENSSCNCSSHHQPSTSSSVGDSSSPSIARRQQKQQRHLLSSSCENNIHNMEDIASHQKHPQQRGTPPGAGGNNSNLTACTTALAFRPTDVEQTQNQKQNEKEHQSNLHSCDSGFGDGSSTNSVSVGGTLANGHVPELQSCA